MARDLPGHHGPHRQGIILTWLMLLSAVPELAWSHPTHGPSLGERYVKLDLSTQAVRLVYGLTFSSQHGRNIRRDADADRDGAVDSAEVEAFGRRFVESLSRNVRFTVDGREVRLPWEVPFSIGLEGRETRGPVALEIAARLELRGGQQLLTFEDRAEFEGVYRTTAAVVTAPELQLVRAGEGQQPRGTQRRVVFLDLPDEGAPPPRRLTVEVIGPGVAEPGAALQRALVVVGLLALVVIIVVLILQRRRARTTGRGKDSAQRASSGGTGETVRPGQPGQRRSQRGSRRTVHRRSRWSLARSNR